MNCTPESPKDYPIRPVSLTEIRFEDDFWLPRIETSHRVTIPYAFRRLFLLTGDSQYIDVLCEPSTTPCSSAFLWSGG
jgi:hypothetical protein